MAPVEDTAQPASDAELITRVRAGDRSAFGELYRRHAGAASALSRQFSRSAAEADDLVSEAFARVLDGMVDGKGPDTAFRAYLFTTLRHTAYDRTRKDRRLQFTDDIESHDVAVESDDPVIADLENGLVGTAFAGLPERWQTVLWHTQVEGQSAAEVGMLLGMAPNAVSSLAFRAREGLREAYLQAHLAESAAEQCRYTIERLGAWTRGGLSKREKTQVDAHLAKCDRCSALAAELSEINSGLRGLLAPLLLGGAAAGYLANLGPVAPLIQLGALAGGSSAPGAPVAGGPVAGAGGAAGGHAAGSHLAVGLAKAGGWGPVAAIAGVAATGVVLVAAAVIALTGSKSPPPVAANGPAVAAAGTGTTGPARPGTAAAATPGALPVTVDANPTERPGTSAITTSGTRAATSTRTNPTTAPAVPTTATIAAGTVATGTNGGTPSTTAPTTANNRSPTPGTPTTDAATTSSVVTTPATATSTATTSTPTTSTTATTTPPAPADLSVSRPMVSGVVAGADATLQLVVTNHGGTASTQSQVLGIRAPVGVTLAAASAAPTAPALRTAGAFAMTSGSLACRQIPTEITCPIPAIGPGAGLTVTVTLHIAADAADGNLVTTLNGLPVPSGTLRLAVPSGFESAALSAAFPVGKGAVNRVRLTAQLADGVGDAGVITVGGPELTVVGLFGPATGCTLGDGNVSCPSAAAIGGVTLDVAIAPTAVAGELTVHATDHRGRIVRLSGSATLSTTGIGGYDSVVLLGPGHPLRAGSIDVVTIRGVALNPGVINPGPISIPIGLSPGITVQTRSTGLPSGCTTAGSRVICTPVNGGPLDFRLPVRVSSAAAGPQTLSQVALPAGNANLTDPTAPLTVDTALSGYDSIELTAQGPLRAGRMGALTLTGTPGVNVAQPGPITVLRQLSRSLLITAAQGCVRSLETYICLPDDRGAVTGTLTVAVLPTASAADAGVADAVLDGGRTMTISGTLPVSGRSPGDVISLIGPFSGTMAGAATMRCAAAGVVGRSYCPGGLSAVDPSSATLAIPTGARVISAELTWAATAPRAGPASTLDAVTVSVDGARPVVVHGVRPSGIAADTTGNDPVTSGQLFVRVAGTADQALLADAGPGAHTISVTGLAAKPTAAGASPMGAWSITVIFSTDGDVGTAVTSSNYGQANSSGKPGATVTVIAPAGGPVTGLWQTIWAPDPWAVKTLRIGDTVVSKNITGRHGDLVDGFALLNPVLPAGGLTGSITLTNAFAPTGNRYPDGLWVGPTLVVSSVG